MPIPSSVIRAARPQVAARLRQYLITNAASGAITARYHDGIEGKSLALANGNGFHGYGGHATATTTIINAAPIISDDGIVAKAKAYANGGSQQMAPSQNADPGLGSGGTAVAVVVITNTGTINATYNGNEDLEGIDGQSRR